MLRGGEIGSIASGHKLRCLFRLQIIPIAGEAMSTSTEPELTDQSAMEIAISEDIRPNDDT